MAIDCDGARPTSLAYPQDDRPIGRSAMRWALRFGRHRFELIDELSNMYTGRPKLLTPAFVDFDFWLDEPNWETDKAKREFQLQQIDIMAAIARRPKGPRTHGFMCFDPLRHAFFVQRKKAGLAVGLSPLEIAQRAIDNGFIGVKLYPPMGFRPFNNNHIPLPSYVTDREKGLGGDAGIAIDAALYELYAWCESKQVPIMAHANNSNESHSAYGARASPDNWRKLIESNRYRNLRINLGHFGGFEEYFFNPIGPEKKIEEAWEWKVLQIWKTFPPTPLYADISYFNEILPLKFETEAKDKDAYQETRKQVTEFWREYVKPSALFDAAHVRQ